MRRRTGNSFKSSTYGSTVYARRPWLAATIGIVALVLGGWLFEVGARDVLDSAQSSSWPKTSAHIDQSFVQVGHSPHHTSSWPHITYTYSVGGVTYTSQSIMEGRGWGQADSNQVVADFPAGSSRDISYSPSNPGRSLLRTGLHAPTFCYAFAGLAVTGFGAAFLLAAFSAGQAITEPDGTVTYPPGSLAGRFSGWVLLVTIGSMILAMVVNFF